QVSAPGQPDRSTLDYRMAKLGSGRMPHLGSKVVDSEGLSLIYEWIESLDPDADRTLADDDEVPRAMVRLHEQDDPLGMVALDQAVGDLLLRFDDHDAPTASTSSPESKGDPTAILALESDPARGAELLLGTRGAICLTCHQVGSQGRDFGPAFDGIGSRRTKEHLLESLLLPSAEIEAPYVHYTVTTNSKTESLSGFIRHHDRSGILLRDAALQEITFPIADIATMTASDISVMPPGLGQAFSDNEIADLLAYLESLR
ncbi:MAG: c-type cytochrome, partial [Verrucomicrobiales bacterium]|nr:c-type cytochrome [Verrucomicrobiales bacterium]